MKLRICNFSIHLTSRFLLKIIRLQMKILKSIKNRLLKFSLFAATNIFFHLAPFAQYDGEIYVDEEDYIQSQKWSHFQFENFELGMITLGIIFLGYAIPKIKDEKNPGCLLIGLTIFGLICISPVISGILTLIGRIVGEIVEAGLYLALIAGAIYFISSLIKRD